MSIFSNEVVLMKKKYLSIIVIIFTIIAVWFMVDNNTSYEDDYMMVQRNNNKISTEELFTEIKNKEMQFDDNKIENNVKVDMNKENNDKFNDDIIEKEDNKNREEDESIKENNLEIIKKEEVKKEESKEEKLFKVDKNEILGQLTKEDKNMLRKLIKKLSISDYANILYSIKNNGELECCLKIINILNRRLDDTEYDKAKEIFEPYVNVEFLEEKLAVK